MYLKKQLFGVFAADWKRTPFLGLALLAMLFVGAGPTAGCNDSGSDEGPTLAEAASAVSGFRNIVSARAAGFVALPTFGNSEAGYSGLYLDRGPVTSVNPFMPTRLIYRLMQDGRYELLGAAWVLHRSIWDDPPSLFGQRFTVYGADPTGRDNAEMALYVWLYAENPLGRFSAIHPDVQAPTWYPQVTAARDMAAKLNNVHLAEIAGYEDEGNCLFDLNMRRLGHFVEHPREVYLNPNFPNVLIFVKDDDGPRLAGLQWRVPLEMARIEKNRNRAFSQDWGDKLDIEWEPDLDLAEDLDIDWDKNWDREQDLDPGRFSPEGLDIDWAKDWEHARDVDVGRYSPEELDVDWNKNWGQDPGWSDNWDRTGEFALPVMFNQTFSGPHTILDREQKKRRFLTLTVWPSHDHPLGVFANPEPVRCYTAVP